MAVRFSPGENDQREIQKASATRIRTELGWVAQERQTNAAGSTERQLRFASNEMLEAGMPQAADAVLGLEKLAAVEMALVGGGLARVVYTCTDNGGGNM